MPVPVWDRAPAGSRVQGSGFRVQGHRVQGQGPGFRIQGAGCRVQGSGSRVRVQGSGFRVQGQGSGSRVQGPGSRVRVQGSVSTWTPHGKCQQTRMTEPYNYFTPNLQKLYKSDFTTSLQLGTTLKPSLEVYNSPPGSGGRSGVFSGVPAPSAILSHTKY